MPVRLRITLLFGSIVFLILLLVCGSVYYFSYTERTNDIILRLTNRAITRARLLGQPNFDQHVLRAIDSSTMMALKDKTLQAYNYLGQKVYTYSDEPSDTLTVDKRILEDARVKGRVYFRIGKKEAVAYHHTDRVSRLVVIAAAYDETGLEKLQQLRNILLFSFLTGSIIAFAGGYFFSGRLLRPIKQIADDINEISAQNLARRIHSGEVHDEWQYLSETLNQLLNRLQESFDMQRRFIANASHELSTPLTSISSQLEVSLQKDREAERYRAVMQSVYQDVRHLGKLTQTLLEFAQASGNTGGLEIQPVRIDEVLLALPAEVNKLDPDYTVALSFGNMPSDDNALIVFGNTELLSLAIRNIVMNACKYSDDHKAIVMLDTADGRLTIAVEDKGIGIPHSELRYIFQPFYRVNHTGSTGGFGLGLSLARRIIKLHKGEITVSSRPGEGTLFRIILPAGQF
ncbi:sensor histidine kinase [Pseudoflavitalea sp. X16]|uniref:HAMP domain-containing sensor histidine kinase n=1 Tax=Paraflavitalea devenefica TaxID=2716334 RepID=UPI00141DA784|nr:HAMP domain-containing sensor histidine kinase [Paraflavitalea devenefica]NII28574.1 sensor histidine kinase [Paraflavitalea devenefica]